ncbi:ATP-binding cassette domain-containing protein [Desulfovibrio aminophilus]|uniref:ABC transporter ATP-binding protein n=1 Tax=Desulfovibrio aminophilus TaxID=81425 RepID=UPI0033984CAA
MSDIAISFSSVTKTYPSYHGFSGGIKNFLFRLPSSLREGRNRYTVLKDVSFEVKKGENFAIIGRNGVGKSTLLGLMAGVLKPNRGNIQVNGRVSPLLQLGAGFHPNLSGRRNIVLNGVLLGLTKREVLRYLDSIIEFSEIGEYIDQPVRTYSSGMYAKLGFSIVTILKPEVLLLDEVLAVGDIRFRDKCYAVMEGYRNSPDVTMILVTHSLATVLKSCDRALWIDDKTVKMIGDPNDVVDMYREKYEQKK